MNKKIFALTLMASATMIGFGAESEETFESYAINYAWTSFQDLGVSATVVANPSGDGKTLYVTNTDYNSVPQYVFTLPKGTTLADCTAVGFDLYVSSNDYNENGGNVYKQLHIYLNGQLVYKSTNSSGGDDYPNLTNTNTWTRISISLDDLTLTDEQRELSQFSLAMGINDYKIKYYVDNAFVAYPDVDEPAVDDPTVDDGDIIINPGLGVADGGNYDNGWLIVEDFDGIALGTTYYFCDYSGNVADGKGNAEVVEIAGTQAVKAVWSTSYEDCGPKLVFTLPHSITEYSNISFNLRRDDTGDYAHKPLKLYINGKGIVTEHNNDIPSSTEIAWETKTYSLEGKGLEATNELLFVIDSHINAGWTLFIDNIRLKPKYEIPTGPAENSAIVLTDDNDYSFTEKYEVPSVTYTRTVTHTDWHAICLPFAVADWSTFAADVIELKGVTEADGKVTLEFSHVTSGPLQAGTPYIFEPLDNNIVITEEHATITPTITPVTYGRYTLTGAYATTSMAGNYALKNGDFHLGASDAKLKPFRVYITANAAQDAPSKLAVKIGDEVEDGIQAVIGDIDGDTVTYNLQGVRVDNPTHGIYIRGGKKIIVK